MNNIYPFERTPVPAPAPVPAPTPVPAPPIAAPNPVPSRPSWDGTGEGRDAPTEPPNGWEFPTTEIPEIRVDWDKAKEIADGIWWTGFVLVPAVVWEILKALWGVGTV